MGNCINCTNFHITREELKLGVIDKMKIRALEKIRLDREYELLDENGFEFKTDFLNKYQIITCSEDLILTLESTTSSFINMYNPTYKLYEIIDDGNDESSINESSINDSSFTDLDDSSVNDDSLIDDF